MKICTINQYLASQFPLWKDLIWEIFVFIVFIKTFSLFFWGGGG